MSTGYSWEGIRQVRATLLGVRHVPELSASVVAVSTWGAISSARPLPLPLTSDELVADSHKPSEKPPLSDLAFNWIDKWIWAILLRFSWYT